MMFIDHFLFRHLLATLHISARMLDSSPDQHMILVGYPFFCE